MKKLIALVLALVMCFALCACGQSAAPAATEAPAAEPAAEPAADAAADTAAVEYPEMTLKLSHHNAVDQPIHEALTKWATMINEQSGGKITIDIYPAASLYNQTDAQDAVQMGTLDMCLADCSQLSSAVPAFALTAMPFLYDSYETAGKVIFGEVGAQLDQQLEDTLNMHAFGWTWNNFRNMITKTPITSLDDCKGYKLRSPGTDLYLNTFNTLGMSPTVVPWNEAYTAMQSGLVDGVESGLEAFYTQGFYELGKYVCLSCHMISVIGPVMNADKWNSLDEATQELDLHLEAVPGGAERDRYRKRVRLPDQARRSRRHHHPV
ncbi:MAG: TRAP transporter substrate-binding protein [Oscillospiraceae bacterium]